MSTPVIGGKPATQARNSKKRKQESTEKEDALTSMIRESAKSRQEVMKKMNEEKTVEDVFFETCVLRMKKLPPTTQSFIQLQISQLFVNAENPQLPPIPITPLPTNMPQSYAYCGPSAYQGGNNAQNAFYYNNESVRRNTQSGYGTNPTDNDPIVRHFRAEFGVSSAEGVPYTQGCGESGDIVSSALNIANMM